MKSSMVIAIEFEAAFGIAIDMKSCCAGDLLLCRC